MKIILLYIIQVIFIDISNFFKVVNTSEHGRGAKWFNKILENEGVNCYIPSGNGCFQKCNNFAFKKDWHEES